MGKPKIRCPCQLPLQLQNFNMAIFLQDNYERLSPLQQVLEDYKDNKALVRSHYDILAKSKQQTTFKSCSRASRASKDP